MKHTYIVAILGITLLVGCSQERAEAPIGTGTKIVCDKFKLVIKVTGSKLALSADTDLPDNAIVGVVVSRSYLEKGNPDTYEVDYFSERSTIGKWRSEHIIPIDDEIWKTALMAKQEKMSRLGFGFDVASVSDRINVRMVVPINQPDPRFGNGNENLTGSAVSTGRPLHHMRIVEDKLEIDHPLNQ